MERESSISHFTQDINCLNYQFTEVVKPDKIKKPLRVVKLDII